MEGAAAASTDLAALSASGAGTATAVASAADSGAAAAAARCLTIRTVAATIMATNAAPPTTPPTMAPTFTGAVVSAATAGALLVTPSEVTPKSDAAYVEPAAAAMAVKVLVRAGASVLAVRPDTAVLSEAIKPRVCALPVAGGVMTANHTTEDEAASARSWRDCCCRMVIHDAGTPSCAARLAVRLPRTSGEEALPATAAGTDTVIVSVMTTTGVCVGVGVCVAAAVTDADAPLVVLAVGAGDVVTEAADVTDGVCGGAGV